MAALFGELGANAIHKIAEANGWKDGSPEKIAMHAALAAVNAEIVKGNITAAAVTGGSTETLSNVILKAVGEAKGSSASAQWAAAVVGAALSSATGGDAQSGASIAANAIKNNEFLEKVPVIGPIFQNFVKNANVYKDDDGACVAKLNEIGAQAIMGASVGVLVTDEYVYDNIGLSAGYSVNIEGLKVLGKIVTTSDIIHSEVRMFRLTSGDGFDISNFDKDNVSWVRDWGEFNTHASSLSMGGKLSALLGGAVMIGNDGYGILITGVGLGAGASFQTGVAFPGTLKSDFLK